MTSPPSSSDLPTDTFELLHPDVQRWIWHKGWSSLRDIQAIAIDALLRGTGDLLIAAATASGKTEAAFLPILSKLAQSPRDGVRALYVGPLKALINDQFLRLEELCDKLELPVVKWHGDAPTAAKQKLVSRPRGIVLITPESLEAIFVRRPERLSLLFANLDFIVIDEVHAFLGTERGVQLASLMKRLDAVASSPPRRVGLSATIGDLALAAHWLRPTAAHSVKIVESHAQSAPLQLQVRTVIEPDASDGDDVNLAAAACEQPTALDLIAQHLFRILRGKGNHLVFAGSRRSTEALSDKLRVMCDEAGVPNEFFPHHGNLSREAREDVESRLKAGTLPTTAVATTTLELGIDIGAVETVAQVGAPSSIGSLRQRLGRSGRREGAPAVLQLYAIEHALDSRSSLFDQMRIETVQSVAAVQLLLRRWVEPPTTGAYHLSTLLHQTLSVVCEKGGVKPADAYKLLAGLGPFEAVTPSLYAALLHAMHDRDDKLIEQAPDGTLMLGRLGERLTGRYDFYAVFASADEYSIATADKTLGNLSISNALGAGDFVVFAGRRWKVMSVDDNSKRVLVEPAPAGRLPRFEGEAAPLSDELLRETRKVFLADDIPVYLDAQAKLCLTEGRTAFRRLGLDRSSIVTADGRTHFFPWVGTRKLDTLRVALRYCGFEVEQGRVAVSVPAKTVPQSLAAAIGELATSFPPPAALAMMSDKLRSAKFDYLLPDDLLRTAFARDGLDLDGAMAVCRALSCASAT